MLRLATLRPDPSEQPSPTRLSSTGLRGLGCVDYVDGVDVARLATNTETANQLAVALYIATLHVIEQTAALADHLEEAAPRGVVLHVRLEVLGEVRDLLGEERDLDLGGARVTVVLLEPLDDLGLLLRVESHFLGTVLGDARPGAPA